MNFRRWIVSAWIIAAASSGAAAQSSTERFERQLERIQREQVLRADEAIPTGQRAVVDYGGYLNFSVLAIDDIGQRTHVLRQTEVSGYARVNFDNAHEFFIRVQGRYNDFDNGDAFNDRGDQWVQPYLQRAYYRFDLRNARAAYEGVSSDLQFVFEGGRQLVTWGNGLVLSQDVDGATWDVGAGPIMASFIVARTVDSNVDFDTSRPGFDTDTQRVFYGAKIDWALAPEHHVYAYGLVQSDQNSRNFDPDPLKKQRAQGLTVPLLPTRFGYESWYVGGGARGQISDHWLYSVETAYEGGHGLSNSFAVISDTAVSITQTDDSISAAAANVRFDYLFQDDNRSRALIEGIIATGDKDRLTATNTFGGNKPGTTDRAFNAFGLLNTGLEFLPSVSNIAILHLGYATTPWPNSQLLERLQVGIDGFVYNKLDAQAPLDEPTKSRSYVGTEIDLFANWQIASDLTVSTRYGVFFPGAALTSGHGARHFFYLGLTYAF